MQQVHQPAPLTRNTDASDRNIAQELAAAERDHLLGLLAAAKVINETPASAPPSVRHHVNRTTILLTTTYTSSWLIGCCHLLAGAHKPLSNVGSSDVAQSHFLQEAIRRSPQSPREMKHPLFQVLHPRKISRNCFIWGMCRIWACLRTTSIEPCS